MNKKTLKIIIGTLVVLVVILLVLKSKGIIGKKEGIKVVVEKAAYRDVTETVSASGKIFPEVEVKVSPDVSGEIMDLPVQEGDSVTKGQVIAKIYADIYHSITQRSTAAVSQTKAQLADSKAALGSFKAKLDQAKSTFARDKSLVDQKVISRVEFEQAQSAYQSALADYNAAQEQINASKFAVETSQADLSQAEDNLHRTTIVAPMSGYISSLPVKKGETVVGTAQMAGTEMMRIADMNVMEVQVDVGENDIPKVDYGDTALIQVDAYNNRQFKGIVTKIATSSTGLSSSTSTSTSSAEQVTNYTVHIRILKDSYTDLIDAKNPRNFPFRPGMSASVNIETKTHHHVLTVPINAVTTRDTSTSMAPSGPGSGNNGGSTAPGTASTGETGPGQSPSQEIVFVLQKNGTVKWVVVKTDIQDDNYIEVTSGLKVGDEVVAAPYSAISKDLNNGSKVKVVTQDQLYTVGTGQ
ncbi:MAG: efflux RND transporter periplasmic adaptor subunit [Chitinophagaceae bacterium]